LKNKADKIAVVILAAGKGTRMKSNKAKVLHEILGVPMLLYVLETARNVAGSNVIVVIGHQSEKVREIVPEDHDLAFALQERQRGTGDAVLSAIPHIPDASEHVVILCGDVPLLTSDTIMCLVEDHVQAGRDLSLLAVDVDNPQGYGRVIFDENQIVSQIIEEADATEKQKEIKTINSGVYCINKDFLLNGLPRLKPDNVQGELYLTDIIEIGYADKKIVGVMICDDAREVVGVNTRQDLALVEAIMQNRLGPHFS